MSERWRDPLPFPLRRRSNGASEPGLPEDIVRRQPVARRLGAGTSVFLLGGTVRQGLLFVLLPFLAQVVTPADFGRITVAATVAGLSSVVMGLGLETPVFRTWFSHSGDSQERLGHLRTARQLLTLSSTSVLLIVGAGAWLLPIPTDAWVPALITIAVLGEVGMAFVRSYALPLLRAQERLRAYLGVQLTLGLGQPVLLGLAVLALGWGAVGWIGATALASWLAAAVGRRKTAEFRAVGVSSRNARRRLLALGVPLIPHALSHWALTGADRLVLVAFVSSASVGVYGLTYRIAQVVGIVLTEVNRAMMNEYGRLVGAEDGTGSRDRHLGGLAEIQIAASIAVAFPAAVLGPLVFEMLFPAEYAAGAAVLPWVALGYGLFGMYFVPTQLLVLIEGRSSWLWTGTVAGATVNLVANLLLVPTRGILGAAQATAIGYAVLLVATAEYARRTVSARPRVRIGPISALVALSLCLALGTSFIDWDTHLRWFVASASSAAILTGAIWMARTALHSLHDEAESGASSARTGHE